MFGYYIKYYYNAVGITKKKNTRNNNNTYINANGVIFMHETVFTNYSINLNLNSYLQYINYILLKHN